MLELELATGHHLAAMTPSKTNPIEVSHAASCFDITSNQQDTEPTAQKRRVDIPPNRIDFKSDLSSMLPRPMTSYTKGT